MLVIETCVPENTLDELDVKQWLMKNLRRAKDRYVKNIEFKMDTKDVVMKKIINNNQKK